MKTCKMGCGKMKSGGTIKKVKKMAKGGAAGANFGYPLNGLPMRPTNGNTDISKNQMGTNPTMKVGGATDEKCWPGKPGCGHSRANRVNKRRSAANKAAPVVKKILGAAAGAGAAIGAYAKNIGGIKDKIQALKQEKMGGTTRKMAKGGFPDLTKDGKVTKADILKGRGVIKRKGGSVKKK